MVIKAIDLRDHNRSTSVSVNLMLSRIARCRSPGVIAADFIEGKLTQWFAKLRGQRCSSFIMKKLLEITHRQQVDAADVDGTPAVPHHWTTDAPN